MINLISTPFSGLKIIKNPKLKDTRGYFREIFLEKLLKKKFPFMYVSKSKKNVLRGLHFQNLKQQAKIITVLNGEIYDVALDLRRNSTTFGKVFSIKIKQNSDFSLFIPEGFAHGFMATKDNTIMLYQCSNYRHKNSELGISWDDKELKISWPKSKNKILSNKDKKNISFDTYKTNYLK
jgi:dTDP-4-dehydrorhamnose 3,5-epimerase